MWHPFYSIKRAFNIPVPTSNMIETDNGSMGWWNEPKKEENFETQSMRVYFTELQGKICWKKIMLKWNSIYSKHSYCHNMVHTYWIRVATEKKTSNDWAHESICQLKYLHHKDILSGHKFAIRKHFYFGWSQLQLHFHLHVIPPTPRLLSHMECSYHHYANNLSNIDMQYFYETNVIL